MPRHHVAGGNIDAYLTPGAVSQNMPFHQLIHGLPDDLSNKTQLSHDLDTFFLAMTTRGEVVMQLVFLLKGLL